MSFFIRLCLGIKQVINPVYKKRAIEHWLRVIIMFVIDMFSKLNPEEKEELTEDEKAI